MFQETLHKSLTTISSVQGDHHQQHPGCIMFEETLHSALTPITSSAGCIMFEETLYQSTAAGKPFVDVLREQGIIPGIKVDTGLQVGPAHLQSSLAPQPSPAQRARLLGHSLDGLHTPARSRSSRSA